jgi:flagellar motor switch protein FliN/FliY
MSVSKPKSETGPSPSAPSPSSPALPHVPSATAPATAGSPAAATNIDRILDVKVEVTVELGRRRLSIAEILELGAGTVIEFTKAADQPLDIRVNGGLVARGEAVVVGDRYGVRVTEVVSPNERLRTSGYSQEEAS